MSTVHEVRLQSMGGTCHIQTSHTAAVSRCWESRWLQTAAGSHFGFKLDFPCEMKAATHLMASEVTGLGGTSSGSGPSPERHRLSQELARLKAAGLKHPHTGPYFGANLQRHVASDRSGGGSKGPSKGPCHLGSSVITRGGRHSL